MKEYEIVLTYLNGCAGEAYPIRSIEEVQIASPEQYLRSKHTKDHDKFVKEVRSADQVVYTFSNGAVTYIYEFNEL
jgi:hypothetical protein